MCNLETMNYYYLSNGQKMSKSEIDKKISQAKKLKWQMQLDKFGYNFCENCKRVDKQHYDTSHKVSVNDCQRNRQTELAFDVNNLQVLCREHHIEHENKSKIK